MHKDNAGAKEGSLSMFVWKLDMKACLYKLMQTLEEAMVKGPFKLMKELMQRVIRSCG